MRTGLRVLLLVAVYALALLSAAAGIPKILQMPQELGFLQFLGFSAAAVSILGIVQLAGGVLLLLKKTRTTGAVLAGIAMLFSSIALYVGGNTRFALITFVPLVIAIVVFVAEMRDAEKPGRPDQPR